MKLVPMAQNVSRTDRTPRLNAVSIGTSFFRFQADKTKNFSEERMAREPANISRLACCLHPDPVGLNPRWMDFIR